MRHLLGGLFILARGLRMFLRNSAGRVDDTKSPTAAMAEELREEFHDLTLGLFENRKKKS